MVANNTLDSKRPEVRHIRIMLNSFYLLLWIVSRVRKETWKYTSSDAVRTGYDNTMMICVDELIVEHATEHTMHEFAAAVGQDI